MMTTQDSSVAILPIASIRRSPTNPRKRFSESAHAEMTASVRKHGVMQPVLLRPWPDEPGLFELVAGERRYRAAEAAGLTELPALVKDLSDDEVLHIQIIENLQRKDLHPLEEADGYKVLADRGHTLEQIAEEVSQTRSYVAQRLKLCSLNASSRKLFFDELLNAKTALIIARLPIELQDKAAKEITAKRWNGEQMSAREVSEHVQEHYMLRLDQAPFKTSDAELVASAGACGPCPKRTGNQVDLFGDVKSKEICTDPTCFEKKKAAAAKQKREEAEAAGRTVITGKQAKQVKPYEYGELNGGYVDLDKRCYDDPKQRTYRQILGAKGVKSAALLEDPHGGKLVDVMQKSDLKKALADKGIEARSTGSANPSQSAENAKKKAADAYRGELFRRVREKHLPAGGLDNFDLKIVAVTFYRRLWSENQKRITKLYDWGSKPISEADFAKKVDELESNEPELLGRLVMDIALIDESVVPGYATSSKPELLEALARVRGIDPAAIKKELDAAKPKAKPPAKKAAAKKAAVEQPPVAKPSPRTTTSKKFAVKKVPAKKAVATPKSINSDEAKVAWPFPSGSRP
ncbi:ParB/RepB/Spo0J family partition protein [Paraburkholderia phenoliruptrix]|uniref:ParB/RepB/Spo0J family partition protein n=1 Tax=Paraburkholderia phenoliruptrix TaxID=252970 RepID=UPI001C6E1B81|nr:ParB/RepB/Spo0J family partition protein [Paraburkholderia phenoliruptrix]MBW9102906.1 ParB/RepB/Spo0J family partition protein [Paraburkholderia phenoliruptrix]MBW9132880.1 ParB/RepB/Spo0J family partition protein [Paraburkholderia ginsengiterrae]